jgi:hypothetical protein
MRKVTSIQSEVEASPAPVKPAMDPSSFPDGGREAWLVVFGAFCSLFVSFGESSHEQYLPNTERLTNEFLGWINCT